MEAQPASSSLALTPPPPKSPPPMAGKGTEGHRGTAEKTRHNGVQPLNPGVTVKGLRSLPQNDIYAWLPPGVCSPCIHQKGMHTFILTPPVTLVCGHVNPRDNRLICSSTHSHIRFSYVFTGPVALRHAPTSPVAYWAFTSTPHPGLFGANNWHAILSSAVVSGIFFWGGGNL